MTLSTQDDNSLSQQDLVIVLYQAKRANVEYNVLGECNIPIQDTCRLIIFWVDGCDAGIDHDVCPEFVALEHVVRAVLFTNSHIKLGHLAVHPALLVICSNELDPSAKFACPDLGDSRWDVMVFVKTQECAITNMEPFQARSHQDDDFRKPIKYPTPIQGAKMVTVIACIQ